MFYLYTVNLIVEYLLNLTYQNEKHEYYFIVSIIILASCRGSAVYTYKRWRYLYSFQKYSFRCRLLAMCMDLIGVYAEGFKLCTNQSACTFDVATTAKSPFGPQYSLRLKSSPVLASGSWPHSWLCRLSSNKFSYCRYEK